MDSFNLSEDIKVMCITAAKFPDGIEQAHLQMRSLLPIKKQRRSFGISWPDEQGNIIYKAAAEEIQNDESAKLGLETFLIKKGNYNTFYIKDHIKFPGSISDAFQILLGQQEVDPLSYRLEWYIGENDVKCMVPVDNHLHFTGLNKE